MLWRRRSARAARSSLLVLSRRLSSSAVRRSVPSGYVAIPANVSMQSSIALFPFDSYLVCSLTESTTALCQRRRWRLLGRGRRSIVPLLLGSLCHWMGKFQTEANETRGTRYQSTGGGSGPRQDSRALPHYGERKDASPANNSRRRGLQARRLANQSMQGLRCRHRHGRYQGTCQLPSFRCAAERDSLLIPDRLGEAPKPQ